MHQWHMEVPRLGEIWSYSCGLPTPLPQQCHIRAMSVTHATAHSNMEPLTDRGQELNPQPYGS